MGTGIMSMEEQAKRLEEALNLFLSWEDGVMPEEKRAYIEGWRDCLMLTRNALQELERQKRED